MTNQEIVAMITEMQEMKRIEEEAEKAAKAMAEKIKSLLGDDDIVGAIYGPYKVTCKEEIRRTVDGTALRKDFPELAEKYTNVSVQRPLRIS